MDTQLTRQTHPIVIIAGIAVTLFSLAGIGAIMGWIPTSGGVQSPASPAASGPASAPQPAAAPPAPTVQAAPVEVRTAPAARRPKPQPATRTASDAGGSPAAKTEPPVQVTQNLPPPPAVPARQICADCGTVESVREIEKAGDASGLGAVGGAVVGGVLGNQMGGGRGRDVMTVLGAVGGGIAGHQVEKNARKTKEYQITIRFEDGTTRVMTQDAPPPWRPGDKIKVVNGVIQPNG